MPSAITRMRSAAVSNSESSEEMTSIALPLRGEIAHQRYDLGLGADVHSAGWLVEDKDVRLGVEPFPDHHLLLIAARERAHGRFARGGLDPQGLRSADPPLRAPGRLDRKIHEARRSKMGTEALDSTE